MYRQDSLDEISAVDIVFNNCADLSDDNVLVDDDEAASLESWSLVSTNSDSEDNRQWMSIEQDFEGNVHVMSVASNEEDVFIESTGSSNVEEDWEPLKKDYTVILASDKSTKQKVDKRMRMESLALGVSSVAIAAAIPTSSIVVPFLLLNSVDLIRLGTKGRLSKLPFEQKDVNIGEIMRRLSVKNSQLATLSMATMMFSSFALHSIPIPFLLLEQLSSIGLDISTFQILEKVVTGAMTSLSSSVYLENQKKRYKIPPPAKKKDKVVKRAVWGGVTGAAGGMIGPVLNSPVAEKCVIEAFSASANLLSPPK